jgi:hypothetical protein
VRKFKNKLGVEYALLRMFMVGALLWMLISSSSASEFEKGLGIVDQTTDEVGHVSLVLGTAYIHRDD